MRAYGKGRHGNGWGSWNPELSKFLAVNRNEIGDLNVNEVMQNLVSIFKNAGYSRAETHSVLSDLLTEFILAEVE